MSMEMVPTQEPVMTPRADLVAILEELRDVLIKSVFQNPQAPRRDAPDAVQPPS